MAPQSAPPARPAMTATMQVQRDRDAAERRREPDVRRRRRRHEHLAAATDVEQADAEAQRDTEAGRDERCREAQRLGERLDAVGEPRAAEVVDRALEQRGVRARDRLPDRAEKVAGASEEVAGCGLHVLVAQDDEDRAGHEREQHGEHRDHRAAAGDLPQGECEATAFRVGLGRRAGLLGRHARLALLECDIGFLPLGRDLLVAHAASVPTCSPAIMSPSTSRGVSPGTMPTMPPRYITTMRSARATHLVEFGGDDDDGDAGVARRDDLLVHELDRADVEPTGGLRCHEQLEFAAEFAGEHDLLLVTAGEAADVRADALRADVERLDLLLGELGEVVEPQARVPHERLAARPVEHEVLGDRELGDEAVLLAVLRDEADAGVEHTPDRAPAQRLAVEA